MLSIAFLLLGVGLLLTGINFLSDALKRMGGRVFRLFALRYMTPRWKALLLGLGSGTVLQSTSAAMVILASLNSAGSLTAAQAMSILTGFSVGNCLMPFLVTFQIKTAVFLVVGVSSILLNFTKTDRLRNVLSIAFGLGLIFFGIEMMLDGVRPLRSEPWFGQVLEGASHWPGLSIVVGAVLGFLVQSSTAVVVVAIGLAKGGILPGQEIFLIMYGAALGSTFFKTFFGFALGGSGRQLVRFVNVFNFTGAGLFVLLYYCEVFFNVPLVMALLSRITSDPALQAAWAFLLLNLTSATIYTAFHHPVASALARQFPSTEEERLSKPQYLWVVRPEDPYAALELIGMEQLREFEHVAALLPTTTEDVQGLDLKPRRSALKTLDREIEFALGDVSSLRLAEDTAQWHAILQTRQTLIRQIMDCTVELATSIQQARKLPDIASLSMSCLESIDFLILHAIDLIKSRETEDVSRLALYSDRGSQMQQLREKYLNANRDLMPEARTSLLALTMGLDKCIWLLDRILSLENSLRQCQNPSEL